jgi:hypothetical protein
VLNLETNKIVETCEVTFNETQPCSALVFECVGDERNLAKRYSRMRCSSKEMMKMVVWRPRLSMYILLQLRSRSGLLPQLRQCAEIERMMFLRRWWLQDEKLPDECKWITQLRGSIFQKTLDTRLFISIG